MSETLPYGEIETAQYEGRWQAWHVNRKNMSDEPIGYGDTKDRAIIDLQRKWARTLLGEE